MNFFYTKLFVSIFALLFLIYFYLRYFKRDSIFYYERKVKYFYNQNKFIIFLFILLFIIGILIYRIEEQRNNRVQKIKLYSTIIKMLAYLNMIRNGENSINHSSYEDFLKLKQSIINDIYPNIIDAIAKRNKKQCEQGVCKPINYDSLINEAKQIDDIKLEQIIKREIELLKYVDSDKLSNSIKNALIYSKDGNYDILIDILTDEIQSIYPNITGKELCGLAGDICLFGLSVKHPFILLALAGKGKQP